MKKIIQKLADSLMSKEQMKSIKGGVLYCMCDGQLIGFPDGAYDCEFYCAGGGHCTCCATGCQL